MTDKSAEIHLDREMRFVARMSSGHEVVMDDRNGDSGARPTELVLAGLGGCTAMDVTSILRKKRQEVTRLDVRVGAKQREAYPQIFTDIDLLVEVEGPRVSVEAVCQAIELAARKYCSVERHAGRRRDRHPPPLSRHRDGRPRVRRVGRGRGERSLRATGSALRPGQGRCPCWAERSARPGYALTEKVPCMSL